MRIRWAPGANPLGLSAMAVNEAMETERAMARTFSMAPPESHRMVLAEVERREALMGKRAAYESVGDDLQSGRWQP